LKSYRHRNAEAISFTYKHFPVSDLHRHAFQAAEAAECARAQGHFWPMHDLLITNQDRLDIRSLYAYAQSLGLDMVRFTSDMDEEVYAPRIRADIYGGTLAGVHHTPTYFVDGVMVDATGGLRALLEATQNVATQRRRSSALAQ
jgi:protein-disulfide isomerase